MQIRPRKPTDRGGYACMPLKKNVPEGHSDWKETKCPACGRACWALPQLQTVLNQGATALCTECALRAGQGEPPALPLLTREGSRT